MRAIIVYPMNALINSQLEALEDFKRRTGPDARSPSLATPARTANEDRERIIDDPPHILLTNYVMLEYMLIRPTERACCIRRRAHLQFLVDGRAARLSRPAGRGCGDAGPARPREGGRRSPDDRHERDGGDGRRAE